MVGNTKRIPHFIKAKNEQDLHEKILALQMSTHMEYYFISIYPIDRGVIAWYYAVKDLSKELGNLLNG